MPYSTPPDIRLLVETSLTDAEIASLIEESDAEIDHRLAGDASPSALVRRLCVLLTARHIRSAYPESVSVGEYSESASGGEWGLEVERLYRLLTKPKVEATKHRFIDEDTRYPEAP